MASRHSSVSNEESCCSKALNKLAGKFMWDSAPRVKYEESAKSGSWLSAKGQANAVRGKIINRMMKNLVI